MISSARHGCGRTFLPRILSPPFLPIPPAESSRQAILRSQALQCLESPLNATFCRKGKQRTPRRGFGTVARYATAVALLEKEEDPLPADPPDPPDNRRRLPLLDSAFRPRSSRILTHRDRPTLPPLPMTTQSRPQRETSASTKMAGYRASFAHDPIAAFLRFPNLDQSVLEHFTAQDFDNLALPLTKAIREKPEATSDISTEKAEAILLRFRAHLCSLDPDEGGNEEYRRDTRFRGGRITAFFMLCVQLRVVDLAKTVFYKDLLPQIEKGTTAKAAKRIINFLVSSHNERLLIQLFSSPDYPAAPLRFPTAHLTGRLLETIMQAHLRLRQPNAVVKLFDLHSQLKLLPTLESYAHQIQALIELGHIEAVRALRKEMKSATWTDQFRQRLAIMRGQRSLGFDAELEKFALADIDRLNAQPATKFLHALILLRLDRGDTNGAKRLLSRFDLGLVPEERDKVPPDSTTLLLAFKTIARHPEIAQLRVWWDFISSSPGLATDAITALLAQALCEIGLANDAFDMVSAAMSGVVSNCEWRMPPYASKPSIFTCNALLQGMAEEHGADGLMRTAELMRESGVKPDDQTLEYIIVFAQERLEAKPSGLAKLLKGLLDRMPDLRPTIGQLDAIMAEAVKRAGKSTKDVELGMSIGVETTDPTAGLIPIGFFDEAIHDIIQSLRKRGFQSGPRSLANRLRFEAMTGGTINGIPSARLVWNDLIKRGYRPGRRHILALMQGYATAGSMAEAEDVVDLARETDVPVTRAMLMVLLNGWAAVGQMSRAEHAYESIRRLGTNSQGEGLDIIAVTAMIKAFQSNGMFKAAVEVVMSDLPALNKHLDEPAVVVAATALSWFDDSSAALNLIRSNGEKLNFAFRRLVRKIRVRLYRKITRKTATTDDMTAFTMANEMLERDSELRPANVPGAGQHDVYPDRPDRYLEMKRIMDLIGDPPDGELDWIEKRELKMRKKRRGRGRDKAEPKP